jgi:hypothetical protein
MVAATGWLPHTTRAALTGLKKKDHVLERSKRGETKLLSREGERMSRKSFAQRLVELDVITGAELSAMWERVYMAPAPRLSADLLRMGMAYRLQEKRLLALIAFPTACKYRRTAPFPLAARPKARTHSVRRLFGPLEKTRRY